MPLATTTPFSSTAGAVECHTSVSGRLIVSDEAPALFEVFLKVGQSAASSEATVTRQHTATNASLRVKLRSDTCFIKSLFIGSRCQIRRKNIRFWQKNPPSAIPNMLVLQPKGGSHR